MSVPDLEAVMTPVSDGRRRDLAELMGLRDRSALRVAAYFGIAGIVMVIIEDPTINWPGFVIALVAGGIAAGIVLTADGDPLPPVATAVAVAAQAVMVWLGCAAVHGHSGNANSVVVGTVSIISAILCIRGRWLVSLLSILGFLGLVYERTSAMDVAPIGIVQQWVQAAPVFAMALVFAIRMRPTADAVYELRATTAQEAADRAAHTAALAERDRQWARLDAQARELLERIAAGETMTDGDVAGARLVQARLRDGIRAPGLSTPEMAAAVWSARERGASVTVLDDRAVDDAAEDAAMDAVRRIVERRLGEAGAGSDVTVRVLPAGRSALATMLIRDGDSVQRLEFDDTGALT